MPAQPLQMDDDHPKHEAPELLPVPDTGARKRTWSCDSHLRSKTPLLTRQAPSVGLAHPGLRTVSCVSSSGRQCRAMCSWRHSSEACLGLGYI